MDACSNKVDSLYRKILNNNEESSVLASIRDTLLPKLISGELRVPDAGCRSNHQGCDYMNKNSLAWIQLVSATRSRAGG